MRQTVLAAVLVKVLMTVTVTTVVDDPVYLAQPFITSSSFKKEADGSKWSPVTCKAS